MVHFSRSHRAKILSVQDVTNVKMAEIFHMLLLFHAKTSESREHLIPLAPHCRDQPHAGALQSRVPARRALYPVPHYSSQFRATDSEVFLETLVTCSTRSTSHF